MRSPKSLLGMTPSRYRAGGANEEIRFAIAETSLGALLVASSDKGVCAILWATMRKNCCTICRTASPRPGWSAATPSSKSWWPRWWAWWSVPGKDLDLPLDIRGTAFQQRVWKALTSIPAGKTASYADIARKIGRPQAVRAVAQACAANNLAIAIPCHRVVKNDGGLSGYRWGVARKKELLAREEAA